MTRLITAALMAIVAVMLALFRGAVAQTPSTESWFADEVSLVTLARPVPKNDAESSEQSMSWKRRTTWCCPYPSDGTACSAGSRAQCNTHLHEDCNKNKEECIKYCTFGGNTPTWCDVLPTPTPSTG